MKNISKYDFELLLDQVAAALEAGDVSQAQVYASEAMEVSIAAGWTTQQGKAAYYLAKTVQALDDAKTARAWLETAWERLKRTRETFWKATVLFELAGLILDDPAESERLYALALQYYQKADDRSMQASTLYVLGHIARINRDLALAEERYRDALQLTVGLTDLASERAIRFALGRVAREQDKLALAREQLEDVYMLDRTLSQDITSERALGVYMLGRVVYEQGEVDLAERFLREALALFDALEDVRSQGLACCDLGNIAWDRDKLDRARSYFERAQSCFTQVNHVSGLELVTTSLAELDQY